MDSSPTTDHVTTGSHPVHWSSTGEGPALVLLHGLGGDQAFWAAELPQLRDDFQVITVDLRGSGGTPVTDDGHSTATLADAVCAVLVAEGSLRAVFPLVAPWLSGGQDRLVSEDDAAELASGIAGATASTYVGSGHLINVEEPERFVAQVRAFVLGGEDQRRSRKSTTRA